MPWKSIFFWILIVVLVILWCALIIDIVILFNAKSRIDKGASEDGIKYSELSFSIVMTIALVVVLPFALFLAIRWWLKRDTRANDLKARYYDIVDQVANGAATGVRDPAFTVIESAASLNNIIQGLTESVNNKFQDIQRQVQALDDCVGPQKAALTDFIENNRRSYLTDVNQNIGSLDTTLFSSRTVDDVARVVMEAARQAGRTTVEAVINADSRGTSTAMAAAAAAPSAMAAAAAVGSSASGSSSRLWNKFKSYFARAPPPVGFMGSPISNYVQGVAGSIGINPPPGVLCPGTGREPPCGNVNDFVANLQALDPQNPWTRSQFPM